MKVFNLADKRLLEISRIFHENFRLYPNKEWPDEKREYHATHETIKFIICENGHPIKKDCPACRLNLTQSPFDGVHVPEGRERLLCVEKSFCFFALQCEAIQLMKKAGIRAADILQAYGRCNFRDPVEIPASYSP